jgi:hypothetical protein
MSGEVRVETNDLRAKAIQIENLHLIKQMLGGTTPQPPDTLSLTKTAVDNLQKNATFLVQNQLCGSQEGDRLAETLRSVAQAYADVDAAAKAELDGVGPAAAPVVPAANSIPPPTLPAPLGAPAAVTADEVGDVEKTQSMLSNGDHGASLRAAATEWSANAATLRTAAGAFKVQIQNWEGDAADQAYAKFVKFGDWLSDLGDAWDKLAGEAVRISDAHVKALLDHTPVYQKYVQLKNEMIAAIPKGGGLAHQLGAQLDALHRQSEAIVEGYAGQAAPHSVSPANPLPSGGAPTIPVTSNGDPRSSNPTAGPQSGAGGGAGGGGGEPQSPSMPQAASPMSANPASVGRGFTGWLAEWTTGRRPRRHAALG